MFISILYRKLFFLSIKYIITNTICLNIVRFIFHSLMMKEKLLSKSLRKDSFSQQLPAYHPFKCPPDLKLAEYHRKATKVGKIPQNLSQQLIICPCCDNVINKKQFGMLSNVEEFANIGIGYTLFFILYKYFAIILLFVFIASGGAFFFIVNIQCSTSCVKFFGIPIMSEHMAFSQEKRQTQIIHIVTAVFLLALIIVLKHFLSKDIEKVEKKVLCPSQYTIMIQNLPMTKLDFYDFKKWIHEKLKCLPISINVAYNTNDFFKAKQIREQLEIEKNKLIINRRKMIRTIPITSTHNSLDLTNTEIDNQIKAIHKKIQEQKKIVSGYYNNQIQQKQIGTVFVTFNSAQQVERILSSHQKTFINFIIQKIAGLFKSRQLQYKGNQLVFCRAPGPRQVLWDNLQFSYIRNIFFDVCFVIGMVMFMILTFRIQYWFVSKMYNLRHEGQLTGNRDIIFQAIFMSILIMVLNILLRVIIQLLTKLRRFYSYTKQQSSFCSYYSLVFIVNSCFTIYIVHGNTVESSNKLLLVDIHTIMLTNAFSQPLFKIFDPIMWIKMLQKFRIQKTSPQNNPYTQSYIHKLWQGHQISNADNYQYIIRVLFITVWFANIAPLGVLFSLLGMLCDYWIIKFLFIKVYKQPKTLSKQITKSLNALQLIPLVYIGGIMPFLYKVTFTLDISTFFNLLFHYGITTIMILISILAYLYKFRPKVNYITDKKYSDVQLAFGFNYQTQNPATKIMGQKKFLQQILKKQKQVDTQHLIKNILDQTESGQFQANNTYVNKLKLTLSRKITSKIDNNEPFQIEMKPFHEQQDNIRQSVPAFLKRKIQKF